MTLSNLLAQVEASSARLHVGEDGRLRVQNGSALPADVREAILAHRADLLALLASPAVSEAQAVFPGAQAVFPGAQAVAHFTADQLQEYFGAFVALTLRTFPGAGARERFRQAAWCLWDLLPGRGADHLCGVVAQYCFERLERMTLDEIHQTFGGEDHA